MEDGTLIILSPFSQHHWEWIPYSEQDGDKNMRLDADLFEGVKGGGRLPSLRFYKFKTPTVSFGRTHDMHHAPREKLTGEGWTVVQRPTGGGTVLHKNDLCFSLIWKKNGGAIPWPIAESYLAIHKWIRSSLGAMGIHCSFHQEAETRAYYGNALCFKNPVCSDLLLNGQKIVGGAQWRSHDTALHQGSIQLELSEDLEAFRSGFSRSFNARFIGARVPATC